MVRGLEAEQRLGTPRDAEGGWQPREGGPGHVLPQGLYKEPALLTSLTSDLQSQE